MTHFGKPQIKTEVQRHVQYNIMFYKGKDYELSFENLILAKYVFKQLFVRLSVLKVFLS